mgnify:CR=1 FL=1
MSLCVLDFTHTALLSWGPMSTVVGPKGWQSSSHLSFIVPVSYCRMEAGSLSASWLLQLPDPCLLTVLR